MSYKLRENTVRTTKLNEEREFLHFPLHFQQVVFAIALLL